MIRYPVEFQSRVTEGSKFSSGAPTTTTTTIVNTGGSVTNLTNDEKVNSDLQSSSEAINIECYSSVQLQSVTTDNFVVYKSNTYEIISTEPLDQSNSRIAFVARRLK